jgi:hypothetical protein
MLMVPLISSQAVATLHTPWHFDGFPLTLTKLGLGSEYTDIYPFSLSYHFLCICIQLHLGKFGPE